MEHSSGRQITAIAMLTDFIRNTPVQMDRSSIAGATVEGRIVQIPDVQADAEYTFSPGLGLR